MTFPASTRLTAGAAVATLLLLGAGCSGDDDPGAGPTDPASTSASSGAPTDAPTDDPTASVEPATGPLLKIKGVQMNAPQGWRQTTDIVTFHTQAAPASGIGAARLNALPFFGDAPSLDRQVRISLKAEEEIQPKRQPDIEIGGSDFYHLAGPISDAIYYERFGTTDRGYQVTISFEFDRDLPEAQRQRLVEASLASFAWR